MCTDADISKEAREIVRGAAEPVKPGEHVGQQIWRASQRLDISYGKAKAYWYQERARIAAAELRNLQTRLQALHERAEYRKAVLDDANKALSRARRVAGMDGAETGQNIGLFGAMGAKAG